MATVSNVLNSVLNSAGSPPNSFNPKETAKAILADTQIGKTSHHIQKIEAHLDALSKNDPITANLVRQEVMKGLSPLEQGQLKAVRTGEMRIDVNGYPHNFIPGPSTEAWIAKAKADGNPSYLALVKQAGSDSIDAVKQAIDDVYNGVKTLPVGDTGLTVGDGLEWAGNTVSGIDREAIMNGVRSAVCPLPAVGPNVGVSGYAILGGGVNGGLQFDPKTGQFTAGAGAEVGIGIGAKMTIKNAQLNHNKSAQAGYGGSDSIGGGVAVAGNIQAGLVSFGGQYEIAGTASKKDPSLEGRTTAQFGPGGVGANATLTLNAYGSYTTPALYNLGCPNEKSK
jgi:hypothetical protein